MSDHLLLFQSENDSNDSHSLICAEIAHMDHSVKHFFGRRYQVSDDHMEIIIPLNI